MLQTKISPTIITNDDNDNNSNNDYHYHINTNDITYHNTNI